MAKHRSNETATDKGYIGKHRPPFKLTEQQAAMMDGVARVRDGEAKREVGNKRIRIIKRKSI